MTLIRVASVSLIAGLLAALLAASTGVEAGATDGFWYPTATATPRPTKTATPYPTKTPVPPTDAAKPEPRI